MAYYDNVLCVTGKNEYSFDIGWNILKVSIRLMFVQIFHIFTSFLDKHFYTNY